MAAGALILGVAPRASSADDQSQNPTGTSTPENVQVEDQDSPSTRTPASGEDTGAQADDTGKNVRDRDDKTLTPMDQGATEADRELTRKLRQSIMDNDQLSVLAKNIKIITVDGKVTLRGPVNTEQERKSIASIIQQMGVSSVDNQLEVKGTNR